MAVYLGPRQPSLMNRPKPRTSPGMKGAGGNAGTCRGRVPQIGTVT